MTTTEQFGAPAKPAPIETLERTQDGNVITRDLPDGSKQTIVLEPDGEITRITDRVDPSTGATIQIYESSNLTVTEMTTLPNGDVTRVTTFPAGEVEREFIELDDQGLRHRITTHPDDSVETEDESRDPDGTKRVVTRLPDGTEEVRTDHTSPPRPDDGAVVTETTGPEGGGTTVVFPDGRSNSVFKKPDGSVELTDKTTLHDGGIREKITRADGSVEVTVTREITNDDGSKTTEVIREDRVETDTKWPDGSTQQEVHHDDGDVSSTSFMQQTDGSWVRGITLTDGSWERTEHRNPRGNEPARTVTTKSDGTEIEQLVDLAPPGRMQTIIFNPDGSRKLTNLDLEGNGATDEFGPDGTLLHHTPHEPLVPIEPFPDLRVDEPLGAGTDPGATEPSSEPEAGVDDDVLLDGLRERPPVEIALETDPVLGSAAGAGEQEATLIDAGNVDVAGDSRPSEEVDDFAETVNVGFEEREPISKDPDDPDSLIVGGGPLEEPPDDVEIDVAGDSRPSEEIDDFAETVNVGFEEREPISKDPDDPGSLIVGGGPLEQEPAEDMDFDIAGESTPSEAVDVPAETVNYSYTEPEAIGPDPDVPASDTVEEGPVESW